MASQPCGSQPIRLKRVINLDSGVGHVVRGTVAGVPLASLRTACGWAFGISTRAELLDDDLSA
eukprot:1244611-Amphidinium_carterae.1